MTTPTARTTQLRRIVLADGLTSGVTGLALVLAPGRIASLLGAPSAIMTEAIGLSLIAFGLALAWTARRGGPGRRATLLIAGLNLAWVAGSVLVVATGVLTSLGDVALALVGVVVLGFAGLELAALPPPGRQAMPMRHESLS